MDIKAVAKHRIFTYNTDVMVRYHDGVSKPERKRLFKCTRRKNSNPGLEGGEYIE